MGDRNRLAQVFLNLLVNAAHSIPEGSAAAHRITVRTRLDAAEGMVHVEFADTGTGISAPTLDRIFEPFFTTKPFGRGTGLGLSICRSIVIGLGDHIAVKSRPGEGSTFTVSLRPACAGARREAVPSAAATLHEGRGRVRRARRALLALRALLRGPRTIGTAAQWRAAEAATASPKA